MSRYIDADILIADLIYRNCLPATVKRAIKEAPTADVVEVRHGEWVEDERTYCGAGRCNYKCTVCGKLISAVRRDTTEHLYPYCPNCGAKMDGERSNK